MRNIDESPKFNENDAVALIGKYLLIGLTYYDSNGVETDRSQLHGVIKSASHEGISIDLKGTRSGEIWNMPPSFEAIRPAKPGIYTLRATNETIENPDLLCTWAIHSPNPSEAI